MLSRLEALEKRVASTLTEPNESRKGSSHAIATVKTAAVKTDLDMLHREVNTELDMIQTEFKTDVEELRTDLSELLRTEIETVRTDIETTTSLIDSLALD